MKGASSKAMTPFGEGAQKEPFDAKKAFVLQGSEMEEDKRKKLHGLGGLNLPQ